MNNDLDLGLCCACEGDIDVRNMIMLDKKGLVLGTGWGCVVCHLPYDGASAVLCDRCLDTRAEIRFAIYGYATDKQRVKIDDLTEPFAHDMKFHQDEQSDADNAFHIKSEALGQLVFFHDSPDAGDPNCICSWCGELIKEHEFPLRLFRKNNTEARLHTRCWNEAMVEQIHISEREYLDDEDDEYLDYEED